MYYVVGFWVHLFLTEKITVTVERSVPELCDADGSVYFHHTVVPFQPDELNH